MHHITPMGSAARLNAPAFPARSLKRLDAGTSEHMSALKSAIVEATNTAVQQHHNAALPVYVLDNDGSLCVQTATGLLRKLTQAEVDAALS